MQPMGKSTKTATSLAGDKLRSVAPTAPSPARVSVLSSLAERLQDKASHRIPKIASFRDFLENHARVRLGDGTYGSYTFAGREALIEIVDTIDLILGSHTGNALRDSQLDICGGAQFGKTILALNLGAYVTGVKFRNWGYYLPDDDLVEGIVDGKLRPDVIDQIDWFADCTKLGKDVTKSGKAVNRKGAFLVTDGEHSAVGMIRGMGKIPTTFSMDVAMEDEKDDIPPSRSKYLKGRMTASDLRLKISIGTQRYHGAGQNKQFEEGSQHVQILTNPKTGRQINPEEHWPQICRVAVSGLPRANDPQLTYEGDFKRNGVGETVATHDHEAVYYFADPEDGTPLDRTKVIWVARRPERIKERKWSFRVSQMGIAAIDIVQIVSAWVDAVKDPADMIVFCCDRLAMPKSTAQALTPKIMERARSLEKFDMSLSLKDGCHGFGGLDMGDRCWFFAREVESPLIKRARRAEQIASADVINRVRSLYDTMGLSGLLIDARPLVNEARALTFILNGVSEIAWPVISDPEKKYIELVPGGLTWDGPNGRWLNLHCAVVEFALKSGQGIKHKLGICLEDEQTKFFPIIQCNRYESIERAVNELLTAEENIIQVIDGKQRKDPVMRLPQKVTGSSPMVATLESHLLTGSKREKGKDDQMGDFVDKVENHLLLADAYSALAEMVVSTSKRVTSRGSFRTVSTFNRAILARRDRRERSVIA